MKKFSKYLLIFTSNSIIFILSLYLVFFILLDEILSYMNHKELISASYAIFPFYVRVVIVFLLILLMFLFYRNSQRLKQEIQKRSKIERDSLEKGEKLKDSLALSHATLEATADGILVVDRDRRIVCHNQRLAAMWKVPSKVLRPGNDEEAVGFVLKQLKDPAKFIESLERHYNSEPRTEHKDEIEFKDGRIFERFTIPQIRDGEIIGRVFSFRDVTQRKQMEAQLIYQTTHDILTLLPNRVILLDRVNQAIKHSKRSHQIGALLFFDLDQFKLINDSLGHDMGDVLLQSVARRLEYFTRENDTVARWGGDEFAILLTTLPNEKAVVPIVKRYLKELEKNFNICKYNLNITSSVGISFFPKDGQTAMTLLKNADSAMYAAKVEGPNNFKFYTSQMSIRTENQLQLINELRVALYNKQLSLHYQPLFNLTNGSIVGAEALLRWFHPKHGFIPPKDFIQIAEESGLILTIGEWVLHTACTQNKFWQEEGLSPISIAINLSSQQFKLGDIVNSISKTLKKTKLDVKYLDIELTESLIMENTEMYLQIMKALKKIGVGISIDDFGTGYSSLSYLKRFPIDKIKIDQTFVSDLPNDHDDAAIVRAILAMAKQLNLKVIAEGIETREQLSFLQKYSCDLGQGFLFSKAIPPKEFSKLLKKNPFFNHKSLGLIHVSTKPKDGRSQSQEHV